MERNIQTKAIVLSVRKLGDLHKAVTLLCPELGIVDAIIYGGRKGKKTALAPLFSINDILLYNNPTRKGYSLVEAVSAFIPISINEDLGCTYSASFFCEIISRSPSDDPARTFTLLSDALKTLEMHPEKRLTITSGFIWSLMQISGTAPDLESCPVCDRRYIDDEELYFHRAMETPCCRSCSDSEYIILLPGMRRYLRHTMGMAFNEAVDVEINPAAERRVYTYMLRWAGLWSQTNLRTIKELLLF